MGTVAVAFFGGGDEPGKAIAAFGRFAVLSLFLAAILAYGLLPLANDFPPFLIVLGLFMLPIGMWAAAKPMGVLVLAFGLGNKIGRESCRDRVGPDCEVLVVA